MLFETGIGLKIVDPSNQAIEQHLRELATLEPDGDNFAILQASQEENSFMQAAVDDRNILRVEYRDGPMQKHFGADNVGIDTVVVLFQQYNALDTSWKTSIAWQDISADFEW